MSHSPPQRLDGYIEYHSNPPPQIERWKVIGEEGRQEYLAGWSLTWEE